MHDWELDSETSFFTHIYSQVLNGEEGDRMRWSLNGSGTFDVCPFYKATGGTGGIPFPWKSIWRVKSPKRVSFLCVLPLGIKSSLIIPIRRSLLSALVLFVYVQ